jgi:hypothetical protein
MVREMEYFITPVLIVFKLENFEDTKGVVRIHKSKKDRQHKRQKKRDKTKNDYIQNITHWSNEIFHFPYHDVYLDITGGKNNKAMHI